MPVQHNVRSSEDDKPKVRIFGEELPEKKPHGDSGRVILGTAVLMAGSLLLLNNLGVVPWEIWEHIRSFWPVILVLLGLHIIMGNNIIATLTLLAASVGVFGLIALYALYRTGSPLTGGLPLEIRSILIWIEQWQR
jgi:hypothetical protein